ncbi:hypothetical protein [Streptomyces sp. TN58]|uniref:hypothetical protein n=1 Tax=Streptomyces sp. TN58 TaxID=234612 RepID=UPI0009507165|nr:hypothetical protein [Streptomyces sp. TN58]APU40786.1 hypothetical protein BSL84_14505 [Streptomyces sp. TN58]
MTNPYQASPPPPPPPFTPVPPRRSGGKFVTFLVLALVVGGAYGASKVLGADDGKSSTSTSASASPSAKPTAKDPGSPESSSDTSSAWKVGDCGGPDLSKGADAYKRTSCSDSGATFKAIDIKEASILPGSIQCPPGTDVMIEVSISYNGGKSSGIPTNTVCGRNVSNDHPGDAGAGGGQLVKGDCVTSQAKEVPCGSSGALKVLGLVKTKEECPSGTTDPIRLTISIGRPYDVICTDG